MIVLPLSIVIETLNILYLFKNALLTRFVNQSELEVVLQVNVKYFHFSNFQYESPSEISVPINVFRACEAMT